MKKTVIPFITLIIVLIITGCSPMTTKYRVTVDAITAPHITIKPNNYAIRAFKKNTNEKTLLFQYFSQNIDKILQEKGYTPLAEGDISQQIIYFEYGIEKIKEKVETYSEPNISFNLAWGYPYGFYGRHYHPFYNDFWYGGRTTYRKTSSYYNRYITLLAKNPIGEELWRVDVSSVGQSNNLKKIIPILIKAAAPYLGKNTEEPVKLVIKEEKKKRE